MTNASAADAAFANLLPAKMMVLFCQRPSTKSVSNELSVANDYCVSFFVTVQLKKKLQMLSFVIYRMLDFDCGLLPDTLWLFMVAQPDSYDGRRPFCFTAVV